jgi:hypothetical protein
VKGPDDCSPLAFSSGSSNAQRYSGVDHANLEPQRPAFAVSPCNENDVDEGIVKHSTVSDPEIGLLGDDDTTPGTVETPSFLDSADSARAYLTKLQNKATSTNRYFSGSMTVNDSLNAPVFTFVDGDCTLTSGSGFLVVTGTLTIRGNTNFNGVILILGKGELIRKGGGDGEIYGGVTLAAFGRTSGDFTTPKFETDGGGHSTIQYDSLALTNAIASGTNVSGIREF